MRHIKVLFIEPYPTEGPSSRYRVEQYIPYLREHGIECTVRPFVSPAFYKIIYKKGHYLKKAVFLLESCVRRLFDIFSGLRADVVFIHLEAFPFGPPILELFWAGMRRKIIYDLDDAIYMGMTSFANRLFKHLKWPSKIKTIIRISDHVITCNKYLADYAAKINKNVTVIHTSVDTEQFKPLAREDGTVITIGWIGSHSTAPYLSQLRDVISRLAVRYKFNLKIIGAGDYDLRIDGVNIINKDWRLKDEIEEFRSLDIGVYPLPDNEWTYGKTGFKAIQYMSVGVPCVISSVGPNKTIVHDGINGYLARTDDEWVEKLSRLIEDKGLRKKMGAAGRKTVMEKYSLQVNAPQLLDIINRVHKER